MHKCSDYRVNSHFLGHVDTRVRLISCQGACMAYRPKWHKKQQSSSNTHTYCYPKKEKFSFHLPEWSQKSVILD